jgi:uncharacterized NAD(P)/FAD-binding protein YdhS
MADWSVRMNIEVQEGLDDPLAVIGGIVDSSKGIESMLREWVKLARADGHSWQRIADALKVSRQSAWERFRDIERPDASGSDPAFASAVERAYLRALRKAKIGLDSNVGQIHKDLLADALYAADRTNGGLRFKRLSNRAELESRLVRALAQHAAENW